MAKPSLSEALDKRNEEPERKTILDLIERQKPELAKVLPQAVTPERFARIALTELRRTPALLQCSPESLLGALMLAAQLGLEPGPLGHAYFVPFKREVVFVVGYRGIVKLAYDSGQVKDISTGIVYADDDFVWREGTRPFLDHTPSGPPAEREWTNAYAVARLKTGGTVFRVVWPEDVERARKASPNSSSPSSPWQTDEPAMIRKTAVRRLAPMLPQSPVFARGLDADESQEAVDETTQELADASGQA